MKKLLAFAEEAFNNHHSRSFVRLQVVITAATIVSITSIILETVPSLQNYNQLFSIIEYITVTIFTAEYILRILINKSKIRYVISFWGLIDLITILPTFLGFANLSFLKSIRILRLLRLLRILRLAKISRTYIQMHDGAHTQKEMTSINTTIYFIALFSMTIAFGSALYAVEHSHPAYATIPLAMLQAAKIILGGLGQAPVYSVSGEIVVLLCRLTGLALFGLLISVIGSSLNQMLFGHEPKK